MKKVRILNGFKIETYSYTQKRRIKDYDVYIIPNFKHKAVTCTRIEKMQFDRIIIVNSKFCELTIESQLFVLLHEIGHIINNHASKYVGRRDLKLEIEADFYACDTLINEYDIDQHAVHNIFARTVKASKEARIRHRYIVQRYGK